MYVHKMKVATLGTILNHELALHKDIEYYSDYGLHESLYELKTHRAIVRATFKLKELREPVTLITVYEFLRKHGIPKSIKDENELLEVYENLPLTRNTFDYYIDELEKNELRKIRI